MLHHNEMIPQKCVPEYPWVCINALARVMSLDAKCQAPHVVDDREAQALKKRTHCCRAQPNSMILSTHYLHRTSGCQLGGFKRSQFDAMGLNAGDDIVVRPTCSDPLISLVETKLKAPRGLLEFAGARGNRCRVNGLRSAMEHLSGLLYDGGIIDDGICAAAASSPGTPPRINSTIGFVRSSSTHLSTFRASTQEQTSQPATCQTHNGEGRKTRYQDRRKHD
jgi:hypothetical protein